MAKASLELTIIVYNMLPDPFTPDSITVSARRSVLMRLKAVGAIRKDGKGYRKTPYAIDTAYRRNFKHGN